MLEVDTRFHGELTRRENIYMNGVIEKAKIYLRKYRGYCPDTINEYVYYAVSTKIISSNKST
ncbi:MAG: hypothetical protein NC313_13995 [Butyrivibrio sp.]|nr:hypothetical protein [Butyrivibrio sp.]